MKRLWVVLFLVAFAFPASASADMPDPVTVGALEESFREFGPRYRTPDVNVGGGDGEVNIFDFSLLASRWGQEDGAVDFDDDGVIGEGDFAILEYWYRHSNPDVNGDGWVDWQDVKALRPSGGAKYFVVPCTHAGVYFAWRCDGQFFVSGEIAPTSDGVACFGATIPFWSDCAVGVVDVFRVYPDGGWEGWVYAGTVFRSGAWPVFVPNRAKFYGHYFQ